MPVWKDVEGIVPFGMEIKDLVNVAIGIVVTVLFGYFFLHQGFRRKQIVYATASQSLMPLRYRGPDELEVFYKGKPVQGFFRITIWLWNAGNDVITRADLGTKLPLRLDICNGIQVLQATVTHQTREANNGSIEDKTVLFDFLNQGDGIVIDIYADRDETFQRPKDRRLVELVGEVIGAAEQPKFMHTGESWTFGGKAFAIGFGLMLGYFATSGLVGIIRSEEFFQTYPAWWTVAELFLYTVMLGLGFWIVGQSVWKMMTIHRMPNELLMMGRSIEFMHPAVASQMRGEF